MGEDKFSSDLCRGSDCYSVSTAALLLNNVNVLPSTIHKTLKDQRKAGKYRAAKMKSTIETKDRVVARGFSHYSNGQLLAANHCLTCCDGLLPLLSTTTLVLEVSHIANNRVFEESSEGFASG